MRIPYIYEIIFPGFEKVKFYFRYAVVKLAGIIDISAVKVLLYRLAGVKIGKGVFISPDVVIDPHFAKLIEIQDYVIIGWGALIFTHDFDGERYRIGRVKIGRGAVIGGLSLIRSGVSICENAKIPLKATVLKDIKTQEDTKKLLKSV